MDYCYCVYCGTEIPENSRQEKHSTCRKSCYRNVNGFLKSIKKPIHENRLRNQEGIEPPRTLIKELWQQIGEHPVPSPDCSIQEIGEDKLRKILVSEHQTPGTIGLCADSETYAKMVQNGWIEFDDKDRNTIEQKEKHESGTGKAGYPWEKN